MAYTYILSYRQSKLYTNVCDLYRPHFGQGINPSPTSWTLAYSDIPCLFFNRSGSDISIPQSLMPDASEGNTDTIHFHEEQEVGDRWVIMNKNLLRNGTPSGDYGKLWMGNSFPQIIVGSLTRKIAAKVLRVNRLPMIPPGFPKVSAPP